MRHLARAAALCLALAVLTACGGSVIDVDTSARQPVEEQPPEQSQFCSAVAANSDAVRPLQSAVARGGGPSPELSELVAEVRQANSELLATAPGEIRTEVERSVAGSTVQLDALEAGGAEAAQAPEARAALEDPEFAAAGERIGEYVQANC